MVNAFNADLSYDDFVRHQLAGDEIAPENERIAEATGFLLAGPDMVDINLPEERRHTALSEMTGAVGSVFLGLTLGCAQCHDHRADPISLNDYYAFQAFFANTVVDPKRDKQLWTIVCGKQALRRPPLHVKIRGDFRRRGKAVTPTLFPIIASSTIRSLEKSQLASSSYRRSQLALP